VTNLVQIDEKGQQLLKEILKPSIKIEAIIPEDATAEQLWETLRVCVAGYNLLSFKLDRLKPIIGKILVTFQNKPSLYKSLGYQTFEEFRKEGVGRKLGLGRTTLWETQIIARDWPQLVENPDLYTKIGRSKLMILSKFATGKDRNANHLLKMASEMSTTELRLHSEQRGYIQHGETQGATVVLHCAKDIADRWKEFSANPKVHQVVGSEKEGAILSAMMDECEQHWLALYEEHQKGHPDESTA